jgi:hypothetical protein
MFNFFHRTPEINLDCFTTDQHAYNLTPIIYANKTKPQWFKEIPLPKKHVEIDYENKQTKHRNLRSCHGFLEFYKKGVVLESWCDMAFKSEGNGSITYYVSGPKEPVSHDTEQYGNAFPKYVNVKLRSPWQFVCSEDVPFLFVGAEWALGDYGFKVLPGVVDLKFSGQGNFFIMIPRNTEEFFIRSGQPLIHIIPLTEKKLKHKNHLLTQAEYNKKFIYPSSSFYGWRHIKSLIKRNEERGVCPFKG